MHFKIMSRSIAAVRGIGAKIFPRLSFKAEEHMCSDPGSDRRENYLLLIYVQITTVIPVLDRAVFPRKMG